jgi:hypothetical protein
MSSAQLKSRRQNPSIASYSFGEPMREKFERIHDASRYLLADDETDVAMRNSREREKYIVHYMRVAKKHIWALKN